MNSELLSYQDALNLSHEKTFEFYRQYINSSQVDLISSFGFGNDEVESNYIMTAAHVIKNSSIVEIKNYKNEIKKNDVLCCCFFSSSSPSSFFLLLLLSS